MLMVWILVATSHLLYFGKSSVQSSSSYFKRTYGKDSNQGSEAFLTEEFFYCGSDDGCTNVVKTKAGKREAVNGKSALEKLKDVDSVWKKRKGKIPFIN